MRNSKTVILSEGALCVALSTALSWLVLYRMPQGGSLTLELVPLIIFSWRRGVRWGLAAGAVNGLLNLMFGGYIVHPLQAFLEYPVSYAVIGLSGLRPGGKSGLAVMFACMALGGLTQFLCHVVAGVVFFSSYAPEGTNVWVYSAGYNGTFMAPKLLLSAAAAWTLWRRLPKV